jgi:hypothetical protein
VFLNDFQRILRGTIVADNYFQLLIILTEDAFDSQGNVLRIIIVRDEDREERLIRERRQTDGIKFSRRQAYRDFRTYHVATVLALDPNP